ncbi:MAG TPA: radical SAM protein, partial [Terriglobia bacterium]|nr:radical SAM protein [Terriglobia bacterium]
MKTKDAFRAWASILRGHRPLLSIEITSECPLRCPGCYAYEPGHLGGLGSLRTSVDFQGDDLVERVLALVRRYRPIHISIVGGEPLVRFRELSILLPELSSMSIEVQLVTSAVRPIPSVWAQIKDLHLVVSVDGLEPDHNRRRAPATYERILKNISGQSVTLHCTITHQMMQREGYLEDFLAFWSLRVEVIQIWFSLFTPQVGAHDEEILTPEDRARVLDEIARLRPLYPKMNMPKQVTDGLGSPPRSPSECLFARVTQCVTTDLSSQISPCQFGGTPDCSHCGCMASAGLKAVGDY